MRTCPSSEICGSISARKCRRRAGSSATPLAIPDKLKTALHTPYKHYEETSEAWVRAGIDLPPVFIVVCNNTSTSKLVYEWISGWQRPNEDGEEIFEHNGHLKLFRNFDEHGNRFPRPNTLLIDSHQIESG